MLCLLALVAALIVWALVSGTSGNSGNQKSSAEGPGGRHPAQSITPSAGPTDSEGIDERPGGRPSDTAGADTEGNDTAGPGTGGAENGGADGTDTAGTDTGGSAAGTDSTAGTDPGTSADGGTAGGNQQVVSSLPDCAVNNVALSLRSTESSYEATERPTFTLTVSNSQASSCKVDLGRSAAVFAVTDGADRQVWASDDCLTGAAANLVRVPGNGKVTRTFTWDRQRSAPDCATPAGPRVAEDGTYEVEASVPGLGRVSSTFRLRS